MCADDGSGADVAAPLCMNNAVPYSNLAPELHVTVTARTDTGRVRPINEDAYMVADLTSDTIAQRGLVNARARFA